MEDEEDEEDCLPDFFLEEEDEDDCWPEEDESFEDFFGFPSEFPDFPLSRLISS